MPPTVLIVNNDLSFLDSATKLVRQESLGIEIVSATNRLNAMDILKGGASVDYLLMTFAIPRLSDGYLLFAKVAEKLIPTKNIFVFVNELTAQISYSARMHGVERLYEIGEFDRILKELSDTTAPEKLVNEPASYTNDPEKIQAALNEVMGPIGSFIFEQCSGAGKHTDDTSLLIANIAKELGSRDLVEQFQKLLRT
ncbi:MAG: hypothetical protein CSB48_07110 [Proteobacteria bacterium]|nr:MAG: hypothetical protein CSB48_07110 [Pseudomonadota bacterium]PIE40148.1 MAG: hypothetical protein CSA51_01920 [Gammaproteobacteria bacterium]